MLCCRYETYGRSHFFLYFLIEASDSFKDVFEQADTKHMLWHNVGKYFFFFFFLTVKLRRSKVKGTLRVQEVKPLVEVEVEVRFAMKP